MIASIVENCRKHNSEEQLRTRHQLGKRKEAEERKQVGTTKNTTEALFGRMASE